MIVLGHTQLADSAVSWPVLSSKIEASGRVTSFVHDHLQTPDGEQIDRQYVLHPGAVGVIGLDDQERVVLVRQYRHPIRHRLVEPPAGLLDVAGEDYLVAAQRELAEEVGLAAADWRVLVDTFTSPGMASETLRIYLARDLTPSERPEGFSPDGEEADMDIVWAGLADLVDAVLEGRLHNPVLVAGVLATWVAKNRAGFESLRPADAGWGAREEMVQAQSA